MQRGISVPNVGDPRGLVELARDVEAAGWDGFFVWDHVQVYAGAGFEVCDPWMVLAGAALATERVRLGPMVAAPARRRPWILAKQVVTLDHLSDGRAVLGVGLGFPADDEMGAFGEPTALAERAARTDEALTIVDLVLRGEPVDHTGPHFEAHAHLHPAARQSPRPPIWVAATPPHRKPLDRARRWGGVVCNVQVDGDLLPLRPGELAGYLGDLLGDPSCTVVTNCHPEHTAEEYEAAGVDWLLDGTWPGPDWLDELRDRLHLL